MKSDMLWVGVEPHATYNARIEHRVRQQTETSGWMYPVLPPERKRRPVQRPPELEPQPDETVAYCNSCGMSVPYGFTYNGLCAPCEVLRMKKFPSGPPPERVNPVPNRPIAPEFPTPSPVKPAVSPSPIGTGKRAFTDD